MAVISSKQIPMESKIKVLYGGAFDLLHLGHIRSIKKARSYGDYLVVNVNSDARVRAKKGPERPVIPGYERLEMVGALDDVDEVIYIDTDETELNLPELLDRVKPQIFVINAHEDTVYNRIAKNECSKRGITIIEQDRIIVASTLDTTRIITKIKAGPP